jgi:cyclophilin family peptidyl-prolyl cis-trans isomerase/HEAT repeat protein
MFQKLFITLTLISVLFSCQNKSNGPNKFSDSIVRRIYEYKDRRLADSLYQFLHHENPSYRKEAALAFASVQDTTAIERLGKSLARENDDEVRRAIAFAIGQTPSLHSERMLLGALTREKNPTVLSELLEAYGKSTTHWQYVNPAVAHDTIKAEGLSWSIYRAGLRGKADSIATRTAANLLSKNYDERTRLGAAHYFSRSATAFGAYFKVISDAATTDPSEEVRMAAVHALRKIPTPESLAVIKQSFEKENDYRLKVNALRALQSFPFSDVKSTLYNALYNRQPNVAVTASEVIKAGATEDNWIELSNLAGRLQHWRVLGNLYDAAMKSSTNKQLAEEVRKRVNNALSPYEKAAYLSALQYDLASYDFLKDVMLKADTPIVRTTAASTIVAMNYNKDFTQAHKKTFVDFAREAIGLGDPAVIGTVCSALADEKLNYRATVADFSFLSDARKKLTLPRDFESVEPLENAIAYFEGKKRESISNEYNHPIDWEFVSKIPVDQKVRIKTSRGNITIRMLVEDAPGSVENFLKLSQSKYFDKKLFHRVVPNFVIQGGCNRGDGTGSEDYSIRSEFSMRRYKTGSVGMASAGKDTEGTQWFITHSPTPHLDGRYTIFAEVVDGMDAVHYIEVGDRIISVEVLK